MSDKLNRTKIGAIVSTLVICLIILEGGLRLSGRRPTNMAEGAYDQNGDSYKLKKNIKKDVNFPAYAYTVYTNEYGFRDFAVGSRSLSNGSFDVFLGSSDVYGNGVDYEDSFVGIFAAEAEKKGTSVLNLAVGGHHMLDQEALLRDFMDSTKLKPSTVFYCVNALIIPKFDQINQNIIVKNGYAMSRGNWRLAYLRLMAGNISSAFCFFRDSIRRIQERYLKTEVTEKSSEFWQIYSKHNSIRQPERLRQFESHLTNFESFCRQNGMRIVYVYLPLSDSFRISQLANGLGLNPDDYDPSFFEQIMLAHSKKNNIALIDATAELRRAYVLGHELRFKLDGHFNKFANRIIGDYLSREATLLLGNQ